MTFFAVLLRLFASFCSAMGDSLRERADGSNIVIETGDSYAPFNTSKTGTAIGIQIYSKMLLFS